MYGEPIRPFLLLQTREDDRTQADEYRSTLEISGLMEHRLVSFRLEAQPLPELGTGAGQLNLDEYSGIILCGSPFTSTDPVDEKSAVQLRVEADLHRLLDTVVERDYPFLGACYGVGSLAIHQGAVVNREYGEPVEAIDIALTEAGKSDPIAHGLGDGFRGFVGHKEAVYSLPEHAVLLATGQNCPVQMFRVKKNLYATQFHPEMDLQGLAHRVRVYRLNGYFEPDEVENIIENVKDADVSGSHQVLRNFVNHYPV